MGPTDQEQSNPCPCCINCKQCKNFQSVVHVEDPGFAIYRHPKLIDDINKATEAEAVLNQNVFVLHNTADVDITSADFMMSLDALKISCPRCRYLLEHAQKLFNRVPLLSEKGVIGICDHCYLKQMPKSCYDCDNVVKKFVAAKREQADAQELVETWLSKMKYLLKDVSSVKTKIADARNRAKSDLCIDKMSKSEQKYLVQRKRNELGGSDSNIFSPFLHPPTSIKPGPKKDHTRGLDKSPSLSGSVQTGQQHRPSRQGEAAAKPEDIIFGVTRYHSEPDVRTDGISTRMRNTDKQQDQYKDNIDHPVIHKPFDIIPSQIRDVNDVPHTLGKIDTKKLKQKHVRDQRYMPEFIKDDETYSLFEKRFNKSLVSLGSEKLYQEYPLRRHSRIQSERRLDKNKIRSLFDESTSQLRLSDQLKKNEAKSKKEQKKSFGVRSTLIKQRGDDDNRYVHEGQSVARQKQAGMEESNVRLIFDKILDKTTTLVQDSTTSGSPVYTSKHAKRKQSLQALDKTVEFNDMEPSQKQLRSIRQTKVDQRRQQAELGKIRDTMPIRKHEKYTDRETKDAVLTNKQRKDTDQPTGIINKRHGPSHVRKHSSAETLVSSISRAAQNTLGKELSFFFPKGTVPNKHHKLKGAASSSVLIHDTKKKFEEEKIRKDEELKILDEKKKKAAEEKAERKRLAKEQKKKIEEEEKIKRMEGLNKQMEEMNKQMDDKIYSIQKEKSTETTLDSKNKKKTIEKDKLNLSTVSKTKKDEGQSVTDQNVTPKLVPENKEVIKSQGKDVKGPVPNEQESLSKMAKDVKNIATKESAPDKVMGAKNIAARESAPEKVMGAKNIAVKESAHEKVIGQRNITAKETAPEKVIGQKNITAKELAPEKVMGRKNVATKDSAPEKVIGPKNTESAKESVPEKAAGPNTTEDKDSALKHVKEPTPKDKKELKSRGIKESKLDDLKSNSKKDAEKSMNEINKEPISKLKENEIDDNNRENQTKKGKNVEATYDKKSKEKDGNEFDKKDKDFKNRDSNKEKIEPSQFKKLKEEHHKEASNKKADRELQKSLFQNAEDEKKMADLKQAKTSKKEVLPILSIVRKSDFQEDEVKKELKMNQVKVRKQSADDLILQLVKLAPKGPGFRIKPANVNKTTTKKHIMKHKNIKTPTCIICLDSDLELEIESINLKRNKRKLPDKIIIGEDIIKLEHPIVKMTKSAELPMLFQSVIDVDTTPEVQRKDVTPVDQEELLPPPLLATGKSAKAQDPENTKGIIRYALSDRTFIDKGWTMLPTEKVVRKMNVYRMRPAQPQFDWFEHNKYKRLMQYDSGERLAEFEDNGCGRWYYRNGRLALDYYDAEEVNAHQRFVIYSSGEPDERGRSRPITILATFDYLGNGVVFDHAGKIRLKYNQTEGVVLDRGLGPVSHWKWHTLNDPPVLQQVMIDTQMAHKDPNIIKLGPQDKKPRPDNEEMLAIEFDNFIKEKSKKLTQSFKPFQIKMKALKINENFSLKVLDQATVYLIFRDGSANLKLNIGMVLDHKEIVDTDTAEVGEVSNSLERFPARTDSLAGLQRSVAYAQRYERTRTDRERRIRPVETCSSADQLTAAASRPLRPPLCTALSASGSSGHCDCKTRKPPSCYLYYNSRLA